MLVRLCRVLLAAALLAAAAPAAARAAGFPAQECPRYGDLRVCTAQVPSFDGTPLDADLTLPAGRAPRGGAHPLIVLLHGFGNDKHEWQSTDDDADGGDKWHWNSHWFATRGYYVLSYTARGFRTDAPSGPWQPDTPAGSSASLPSGTIQLKSRDAEIRDTQWLAALVAATFPDLDEVRIPFTLAPPVSATVVARVWDVAPDGTARLVTRGAARLDPPAYDGASGDLRLGLFGNHWRVPAGHRLRLDLAQADEPAFRRSTLPATIAFERAELVLPAR